MTTVGFEDEYPRTTQGYIRGGGACMLCKILLTSLPVAIVGSKFQKDYEEHAELVRPEVCLQCVLRLW